MQAGSHYLPDSDRIGVLTATVLMTYALTRLVNTPGLTLTLQLPGFYFAYPLTLTTAMTVMAAGLTATGMDWLLRGHPSLGGRRTLEHWLLPTLTAFMIGAPLSILPAGMLWWVGFAISAAILVAVFVAEYITVDPASPSYGIASAGLTSLSYGIFLIFAISLRTAGVRLFLLVPLILAAAGLVCLRSLHLRISGRWNFPWAAGTGILCAQIAAGLHYWPLTALQFGLVLLGPLYALTALAASLSEDIPLRRAAVEPGVIVAIAWGAAIFLR